MTKYQTMTDNMTIPALFDFEGTDIRITDQNGTPWFVLRDVLAAMSSSTRPADAKAMIIEGLGEEGVVKSVPLRTPGGIQTLTVIHEGAVIYLASRSRTEQGKKLNRFIFQTVLPALRRDGGYIVGEEREDLTLTDLVERVSSVVARKVRRWLGLSRDEDTSSRAVTGIHEQIEALRVFQREQSARVDDMIGHLQTELHLHRRNLHTIERDARGDALKLLKKRPPRRSRPRKAAS